MFSNKKAALILVIVVVIGVSLYFRGANDSSLSYLKLPEGFKIDIFAKDLEDPRVITFDPAGRMLVSETKAGRVILLEDGKDGIAETKTTILSGLNKPHGLAFFSSGNFTYLYVAETQQVARYVYDLKQGGVLSNKGQNIANLPADGQNFTRTIAFGPNYRQVSIMSGFRRVETLSPEKLYISVGSSCDVCAEEDTWKRAAILESDPEGSFTAEFAGGLRNSVFFTFHPVTKEIWATEMGRDNLGDNLPPDEINIVRVAGPNDKFGAKRYGWPFCYGDRVRDKKFNPDKINRIDIPSDCTKTEPSAIEIQAHSAPLGLAFITDKKWSKEWQGDLLVAFHGSESGGKFTGYKIVRYDLDADGNVLSQEPNDFISGWLGNEGKISGRPVDLKFGPDGALYVSDDAAGIIYKIETK